MGSFSALDTRGLGRTHCILHYFTQHKSFLSIASAESISPAGRLLRRWFYGPVFRGCGRRHYSQGIPTEEECNWQIPAKEKDALATHRVECTAKDGALHTLIGFRSRGNGSTGPYGLAAQWRLKPGKGVGRGSRGASGLAANDQGACAPHGGSED